MRPSAWRTRPGSSGRRRLGDTVLLSHANGLLVAQRHAACAVCRYPSVRVGRGASTSTGQPALLRRSREHCRSFTLARRPRRSAHRDRRALGRRPHRRRRAGQRGHFRRWGRLCRCARSARPGPERPARRLPPVQGTRGVQSHRVRPAGSKSRRRCCCGQDMGSSKDELRLAARLAGGCL